jgi:hypothetical protein
MGRKKAHMVPHTRPDRCFLRHLRASPLFAPLSKNKGPDFGVKGSNFSVKGSDFDVKGSIFRVKGSIFNVQK